MKLRLRVFYYFYLLAAVTIIVSPSLFGTQNATRFHEGGPLEQIQFTHFVIAFFAFGAAWIHSAKLGSEDTPLLLMSSLILGWCVNREVDGFWADREMRGIYHVIQCAFALPILILLVFKFRIFWQNRARAFSENRFLYLTIAGGGYIFAQLFASSIRTLGVSRPFKRIIEESIELFFGCFLLFAAVEVLVPILAPKLKNVLNRFLSPVRSGLATSSDQQSLDSEVSF